MKLSQFGSLAVTMIILLVAFENCAPRLASQQGTSQQPLDLAVLHDQLKTLSSSDLSCVVDTDCQEVAVGATACGSPVEYLLVSTRNQTYQSVLNLAKEYNDESKQMIESSGLIVSTCLELLPSQTRCVSNLCVEEPSQAAN